MHGAVASKPGISEKIFAFVKALPAAIQYLDGGAPVPVELVQITRRLFPAVQVSWGGQGVTAVQIVFNPFSQLVPELELYSHLQLSLWSDPIAFSVPKLT